MSNQIVITSGAKLRDLDDVIVATDGILSSVAFNVANGVPRLDENGKILVSQLPNSVMEFKGVWNAATNTPTLVNGTGNAGDVWLCNVAGTVNFGAGPIAFAVGDYAVYTGSVWARSSGATGTVTSVGVSRDGNALTITGSPVTTSGTINLGFSGDNTQYINGAGNLTTFPTLITSIGLTMPAAFGVSNSPLTANGTIGVTALGYPSQYIRGDGTLADFPTSGGGGSSVSYYLNGGTSQGTIGGTTYYEMSKIANTGTMADFSKTGNGFIVAFLTDAGDPSLLQIPAGNWDFEIYASMSANGGTPELYAELYKYDGTTFTLIATSSHEILYDGVNLNLYSFATAVPQTSLTVTDRLAIKLYATNSGGKTTTIHTQDSHLCQIITTFTTGLTALNGLTSQVQYFGTGTSGSDFNIVSSVDTHTFNLPTASATKRGALSSADWSTFNGKQDYITAGTTLEYWRGDKTWQTLNTSVVPELTNLYFTDARARTAISLTTTGSTGAATYNNSTGVLNIPNYADQYVGTVTSVGLSAPTGFSVSGSPVTSSGTLALTFASGYSLPTNVKQSNWDDAYTWVAAFPTQTGNTGKFLTTDGSSLSWAANPLGTVTSVAMSVPTGLTVSGSPITSSGTLAVTLTAGYSIPTNASQTTWDTAYTNRITSLTTTGTSGAATLVANVLNIPQYQAVLTNPITGSLNSGYLPKATGSTTLADSVLYNSGNLFGIGVTSFNSWLSNSKLFENQGNIYFGSLVNNDFHAGTKSYLNASSVWTFASNGYATNYYQSNGVHVFRVSSTAGTAGNTITWLDALSIATNSNVTIGNDLNVTNSLYVASKTSIGTAISSEALKLRQTTAGSSIIYAFTSGLAAGTSFGMAIEAGTNSSDRTFVASSQSGTEYFRVRGDGQVFVSYASTFSGLLTVSTSLNAEPFGQAYFYTTATAGAGGIIVGGEDQAHVRFLSNSVNWEGAGAKKWQIRGRKEDYLSVYSFTLVNDVMRFFSTGNVSIGNTSNAYKLDVTGNFNVNYDGQTALFQSTAGTFRSLAINIRNSPSAGDYGIGLRSSSGSFISISAGSNTIAGLVVNEQGNIGVRTAANGSFTNDAKVLQLGNYPVIYADGSGAENLILASNSYYNGSNNIYTTTNATTRTIYESSSPTITHQVAASGTAGATVSYQSIGVFNTTGFGIKTSPSTLFHIYSATDNLSTFEAGASSGIQIRFKHGSTQTAFINSNTSSIFSIYQSTGTEKISLNSDGQLNYYQIGDAPITNSLYGNIIVNSNGSGFFSRIRFDVTTTPYWGLTRIATSNDFSISGRIGSSWSDNVFRIYQATGNVTIGATVSGGGLLQVNGDVNINGNFKINGTIIGGGGGSGVTGSGTTNYVSKWTSASALGNSLIYDNGTNVSIGATTGSGKLNIFGTADSTFYAQLQVKGTGTYPDTLTGILINAGTAQGHLRFAVQDVLKYQIRYNSGNTVDDYLRFYSFVENADQININASNGYVSLSSAAAVNTGYKLHVAGSVNVTGNYYINGVALASGIGGSGTANYIPKFASTNTLGNSSIYDNGTSVLINSTSATGAKLIVNSSSDGDYFKVISSNTDNIFIVGTLGSAVSSFGFMSLIRGGVNKVYLSANETSFIGGGNLLIGTSTDSYSYAKLQVNGTMVQFNTYNRQTTSYSLVLTDAGKIVETNSASANNVTIPLNSSVAFAIGTEITIMQYGSGQTTIVATSGVTLRSNSGYIKIASQYTGVTLLKVGTNEWYVIGNLTA